MRKFVRILLNSLRPMSGVIFSKGILLQLKNLWLKIEKLTLLFYAANFLGD